jgi:serine/threonine-protein kinase RsbT
VPVVKHETLPNKTQNDIVMVRQKVRAWAIERGFSLIDQTKIITAASELARNGLEHGGGGTVLLEALEENGRKGLRLTFEDTGKGIADIGRAMTDGFTSAGGMGLGLGGAKRLSNEFSIESTVGKGTRVTIARWK